MAKAKARAVGFVLPRDAAATGAPQTLGALPGVWEPGKVHLAAEFGLTDDEVRSFIEQGFPVVEIEVEAKDEKALEKALADARVDEIAADKVEGTAKAEETMRPADDEDGDA